MKKPAATPPGAVLPERPKESLVDLAWRCGLFAASAWGLSVAGERWAWWWGLPHPDLLLVLRLIAACAAGAGFCGAILGTAALARSRPSARLWTALALNATPLLWWYLGALLAFSPRL
jgi:hypothetical protein